MKKAFIIVAHKFPALLDRLITRLDDGNSEFFVHIGLKTDKKPFDKIDTDGRHIHFLPRFDSTWGGYGTIQPFLSGLKAIKESPIQFDRIFLLSGQDYPIKSNKDIDLFLASAPSRVFLNYFPIPDYEKWQGRDRGGWYRVDKYYFGSKWHQFFRSRLLNLTASYLPVLRRKSPNGMKPYAGDTWWIIDRYTMDYILAYHDAHPEYFKFHRHTFVADELFIQMIVGNSDDEDLLNRIENDQNRFTIREKPSSAHPKILDKNDFDLIRDSAYLFARKFQESDTEILDLIDQNILFK